eukprot:494048-Pyramimonas_sp.AAC.1
MPATTELSSKYLPVFRGMEERKTAEETAAAPTAATEYQQGTTLSSTRQPEQHQGSKRQDNPVTLK